MLNQVVYQTKFGPVEGNCQQACLATLFGLRIEEIPSWGNRSDWYDRFTEFMIKRFGVQPMEIYPGKFYANLQGLYIANGPSPRGDYDHSVILQHGQLAHDPYPGGTGLERYTSFTVFVQVLQQKPKLLWCPECMDMTEQDWVENAELWHCHVCGKLVD